MGLGLEVEEERYSVAPLGGRRCIVCFVGSVSLSFCLPCDLSIGDVLFVVSMMIRTTHIVFERVVRTAKNDILASDLEYITIIFDTKLLKCNAEIVQYYHYNTIHRVYDTTKQ